MLQAIGLGLMIVSGAVILVKLALDTGVIPEDLTGSEIEP